MHPATAIAFAAIDFEKNANAAAANVIGHALPAAKGALGKGLDILGWLNSGGGKTEELLRKVMSYNFVDPANRLKNVAGGATIGAGIGGLDADKGHKMKGALEGAVGGGLFGRFAPGLAQKGMGRILTNLVEPRSYETAEKIKKLKGYKIMDMIKAVVKDKPIYEAAKFPNEVTTRGPYSAREVPYRMGFGLKPRAFRKFFTADPTEKGVLHYNPKSREAQSELKSMARDITGNSMIDPNTGAVPKGNADGSQLVQSRGVPGNFHVKPDGSFEDNWDFALHPREKIDSLGNFARAFVNMFTSPVKTKGKLPMPVSMPAISPDAAKSLIMHPGNMGPGVNKLLMGDKKLRGGERAAVNEALNRLMNAAPTAPEVPPAPGAAGNLSGINFRRILGPGGNKIPLPAEPAANGDLNIPFRKVKIPGAVPEPEYSDFLGPNGERLLKSASAFMAAGDLLRTMRSLRGVGGGLGKVEHALTNPAAMGRRNALANIGKAVAAPVLAPALGAMGAASKVNHAVQASDPLRLLQMRSREAMVKGMSPTPVDRRHFVMDMLRGLLNPDVRQAAGTLGTAAVRGAASLAEKIASMPKSAAARYLAFALMDMEKNAMMAAVKSKLFNAAKTMPTGKKVVPLPLP